MTKSDLIEKLCQLQKLPKGRAELLVNCIFQCMEDSLKRGERIEIRGFGSFTVRQYKSYEGRNPRTGDAVHVAPKRLPFFKVGKELRARVNAGISAPGAADVAQTAEASARRANQSERPAAAATPRPRAARARDENLSEDSI